MESYHFDLKHTSGIELDFGGETSAWGDGYQSYFLKDYFFAINIPITKGGLYSKNSMFAKNQTYTGSGT